MLLHDRAGKWLTVQKKRRRELSEKTKRRIVYSALGVAAAGALLFALIPPQPQVLNVYNWGEYISDGSEDSLDTIAAFEDWYQETYGQRIQVNYATFTSNEDMYAKLKSTIPCACGRS